MIPISPAVVRLAAVAGPGRGHRRRRVDEMCRRQVSHEPWADGVSVLPIAGRRRHEALPVARRVVVRPMSQRNVLRVATS